ncbi:MAG: hypothetical protein VW829_14540, partial [Deltaproteobacteria bacterium]
RRPLYLRCRFVLPKDATWLSLSFLPFSLVSSAKIILNRYFFPEDLVEVICFLLQGEGSPHPA